MIRTLTRYVFESGIPPVPSYDSGWSIISEVGKEYSFNHWVGGDLDDYVVEMKFRDTSVGGVGINQHGYGINYYRLASNDSFWNGVYWFNFKTMFT